MTMNILAPPSLCYVVKIIMVGLYNKKRMYIVILNLRVFTCAFLVVFSALN